MQIGDGQCKYLIVSCIPFIVDNTFIVWATSFIVWATSYYGHTIIRHRPERTIKNKGAKVTSLIRLGGVNKSPRWCF